MSEKFDPEKDVLITIRSTGESTLEIPSFKEGEEMSWNALMALGIMQLMVNEGADSDAFFKQVTDAGKEYLNSRGDGNSVPD